MSEEKSNKPAAAGGNSASAVNTQAFIWEAVKPFRKRFALFFLLSGIALVSFTASPFVIRNLINHIVDTKTIDTVVWTSIGLFALLRLFDEWFWRAGEWVVMKFLPTLHEQVRTRLFLATLRKNHTFFVNANSGQIGYWVNDAADKVRSIIEATVWTLWNRLFGFFVAVIFLAIASWKLALVFGIWIIGLTIVLVVRGRRDIAFVEAKSHTASEVSGRVVDALANNVAVRVFNAHDHEVTGLRPGQRELIRRWERAWRYGLYTNMFKGNSAAVVSVGALILVVMMYARSEVQIGDIALFVTYITSASETIWDLSFQIDAYLRDYGSLKNALLNLLTARNERSGGIDLRTKKMHLDLENLSFAYPDQQDEHVLKGLSCSIAAGERVGIVGHSGAGKSTLVALLLGLHDPSAGSLRFNGKEVSDLSLAAIRRNCSYVPQDTSLFNRTIRENILYGHEKVTDAELLAATKRARAHEFIERLPKGYDSLVGERGVKLSGGQRQRIALARAMLSKAPLIVLDEATSALDSVSEQYIQKALSEVMKSRTAIVIAHRLSTLKHLDRILVLDKGRLAEEGTHDELIAKDGIYADLWRRQKDGFLGA